MPITLLGIWAHPDDETYLSATLMNRVVNAGGRVVLVSATRGEQGGADAPPDLAVVRERELRAAMSILGVHDVRFLSYADGECAGVDTDEAVRSIAGIIEDVHPDLVVTFGPDGITHHPDHIAVSRWTTAAAAAVGHEELLYAAITDEFARRHEDLHGSIGFWMGDGDRSTVPKADLALHVVPTRRERELKGEALRAHSSQITGLIELIGAEVFDAWWVDEFFRRPTAAERMGEQLVGSGSWTSAE